MIGFIKLIRTFVAAVFTYDDIIGDVMVHDEDYWNKFYKNNKKLNNPSTFALYVYDKYIVHRESSLLELGCGNGRDSIFFASHGVKVTALDYSTEAINTLKDLALNNILFVNQDFSKLENYRNIDFIYARFTFHSIDEETERSILESIPSVLSDGGLFMLEARSKKDECLDKFFGTDHFRRYLDFSDTCKKIESRGFKIIEKIESQNLSPYMGENPFLLRIIAKKCYKMSKF